MKKLQKNVTFGGLSLVRLDNMPKFSFPLISKVENIG